MAHTSKSTFCVNMAMQWRKCRKKDRWSLTEVMIMDRKKPFQFETLNTINKILDELLPASA